MHAAAQLCATYTDKNFWQTFMHSLNFCTDGKPQLDSLPDNFKNPDLISQIRKEYGLIPKVFSMVITDYDMRPTVRKTFDSSSPSLMLA